MQAYKNTLIVMASRCTFIQNRVVNLSHLLLVYSPRCNFNFFFYPLGLDGVGGTRLAKFQDTCISIPTWLHIINFEQGFKQLNMVVTSGRVELNWILSKSFM
jgi:hypothetical protein